MAWQHIPDELRKRRQWAVAGDDKRPRNPRDGSAASVTDPRTWGTFEEATRSGFPHIGYVITADDPYTFVDLDAPKNEEQQRRHRMILDYLQRTYAETSVSGRGVHIICRGKIPEGVRRDSVELYPAERFMICTGNVINPAPITDCQDVLDRLYSEIRASQNVGFGTSFPDSEETADDVTVLERTRATYGEKFERLWNGEWRGLLDANGQPYPSFSEAAYAFCAMVDEHSGNTAQVRRIFEVSPLSRREGDPPEKRQRVLRADYVARAVQRARADRPPPVPYDPTLALENARAILGQLNGKRNGKPNEGEEHSEKAVDGLDFPPGIVGEIARYIHDSSIRPVREVAIAGALAFMAGIIGRQYNISGTGLNQYVILLAKSGVGKEDAKNGIERLVNAVRQTTPIIERYIGPAYIASGQALIKKLDDSPCFVSVIGEIGLKLQTWNDPRNTSGMMLKAILLDLYSKSGQHSVLQPAIYSDRANNTNAVQAPAFTILGESTPSTFFEGLDESMIAAGLVPRFLVIEYTGDRPDLNDRAMAPPPDELVRYLSHLVAAVHNMEQNNTFWSVPLDDAAERMLSDFNRECDHTIRSTEHEALRELWNRAHLKALRLAALLSVGRNAVGHAEAEWAIRTVRRDVGSMLSRFEQGDVGSGDAKALSDVRRLIARYLTDGKGGKKDPKMVKDGVVPRSWIQQRTNTLPAFKPYANKTLEETLRSMVDNGELEELVRPYVAERYGTTGRCFRVRNLGGDR